MLAWSILDLEEICAGWCEGIDVFKVVDVVVAETPDLVTVTAGDLAQGSSSFCEGAKSSGCF